MILELTYWLTVATQCFIFVFFWNQLFPQRFKQTYFIGVPYIVVSHILIMFCYNHMVLNYVAQSLLKMVSILVAVCLLYKGSMKKKLGIWILTEFVSLLCTLPVEILLSSLYGVPIDQLQLNKNDTIGGMILLNNVLLVVSIIAGLLYNRKKHAANVQFKQTIIMLCFVIVHFGFSCVQFTDRIVLQRDLNCLVHSAFQIMLFILVYVQYITTLRNWELTKQAQELEHIRLQQDYIYNYYLLAEERFKDVAVLRHDMQNLMNTVQELNASEGSLQAYTATEEATITDQHFCSIPVIDAVLRLKTQEAAQHGIHTEFCVQAFAEPLPFSDSDLCSIFANLLDNAIHSCRNDANLTEHFIRLHSAIEQDCFVLTIANSYGWADFPHETTQPDDTGIIGHGHGTKIVESIAKKYSGSFTLQCEDKTVTAVLSLPASVAQVPDGGK